MHAAHSPSFTITIRTSQKPTNQPANQPVKGDEKQKEKRKVASAAAAAAMTLPHVNVHARDILRTRPFPSLLCIPSDEPSDEPL
jgi:hypothetical protein